MKYAIATQNISETSVSRQTRFIGLFFFALSSTYFVQEFPVAQIACQIFFGISLFGDRRFFQPQLIKSVVWPLLIMILIIFGVRDRLFIVLAGLIYSMIITREKSLSMVEATATIVAPLIAIYEILSFWGLPCGEILIWFWGIPFIAFSAILAMIIPRQRLLLVFLLSFILGVTLISNQATIYWQDAKPIKFVRAAEGSEIEGPVPSMMTIFAAETALVPFPKAKEAIQKGSSSARWVVVAPATPQLNDVVLAKAGYNNNYWVFGEHDNLGGFIQEGSRFQKDSYHRKGPWNVFRPIMSRNLQIASDYDPVYASNIGCTLAPNIFDYPLIWSYTHFGEPIIMASGTYNGRNRISFIGDSDSVVKFLAPYNPRFLQALFMEPQFSDVFKGLALILIGVFGLNWRSKQSIMVAILFSTLILFIAHYTLFNTEKPLPKVDFLVTATSQWFAPHIESNFSSLPKNLAQRNFTVAIDQLNRNAQVAISIVDSGGLNIKDFQKGKAEKKIIMLLPGAEIKIADGTMISVSDLPMGQTNEFVWGRELKNIDSRSIIINGQTIRHASLIVVDETTVIIGTGSPQRVYGLEALVEAPNAK